MALPGELWVRVGQSASSQDDLCSLIRVNLVTFESCTPLLYRDVTLSSHSAHMAFLHVVEQKPADFFVATIRSITIHHVNAKNCLDRSPQKDDCCFHRDARESRALSALSRALFNVRRMHAHAALLHDLMANYGLRPAEISYHQSHRAFIGTQGPSFDDESQFPAVIRTTVHLCARSKVWCARLVDQSGTDSLTRLTVVVPVGYTTGLAAMALYSLITRTSCADGVDLFLFIVHGSTNVELRSSKLFDLILADEDRTCRAGAIPGIISVPNNGWDWRVLTQRLETVIAE